MDITFYISSKNSFYKKEPNSVYLATNNWDDFGFKTTFYCEICDEDGKEVDIGSVKIGYKGQEGGWTLDNLTNKFSGLDEGFFSLGQDVSYYENLVNHLSLNFREEFLKKINDMVWNRSLYEKYGNEHVFGASLVRGGGESLINSQYLRVLEGEAKLTEYSFTFNQLPTDKQAELSLNFKVNPFKKIPTNIHALIGRNGCGKTTLLHNLVKVLSDQDSNNIGSIFDEDAFMSEELASDYFSSVVLISFSAFDPFLIIEGQKVGRSEEFIQYVGLKKNFDDFEEGKIEHKSFKELSIEFLNSLKVIQRDKGKRKRWLYAVSGLGTDENFASYSIGELLDKNLDDKAVSAFIELSSGHAIVLLIMTKLVEVVNEKSLILLDEPESHLHPPLLSSFIRVLSNLLTSRNGVAILATHSPVVLQEIPKSCVWKIRRIGNTAVCERPDVETFGENVGILTREVFELEVKLSGFQKVLKDLLTEEGSYDAVIDKIKGFLGNEGRAILKALSLENNKEE